MIVKMQGGAAPGDIAAVVAILGQYKLDPRVVNGATINCHGKVSALQQEVLAGQLRQLAGVNDVRQTSSDYRLCSRKYLPKNVPIEIGQPVDDKHLLVIVGLSQVQSAKQALVVARFLQLQGVTVIRSGFGRPVSRELSVYAKNLQYLKLAKEEIGLKLVCEVKNYQQLKIALRYGAEAIQVSGGTIRQAGLLKEIGMSGKLCLLERGKATMNDLLVAADNIISRGNNQVMLCLSSLPVVDPDCRYFNIGDSVSSLKRICRLPVLFNASKRPEIKSLAKAAVLSGSDGLLLEIRQTNSAEFSELYTELKQAALIVHKKI